LVVRGVTEGGKGGVIPGAPSHYGGGQITVEGAKSPNNVANNFFSTVHLLPKDLSFKHGGPKLASCPGRHLTSVHPCW